MNVDLSSFLFTKAAISRECKVPESTVKDRMKHEDWSGYFSPVHVNGKEYYTYEAVALMTVIEYAYRNKQSELDVEHELLSTKLAFSQLEKVKEMGKSL